MTTPSPEHSNPLIDDAVDSALIASVEGSPQTDDELYKELQRTTPEIALWLRRRAFELNPDLAQRGSESRLALEVAKLFLSRTTQREAVAEELALVEAMYSNSGPEIPAA